MSRPAANWSRCRTCFITLAVLTIVVFKIVGVILGGHRVPVEVEIGGLDIPEMGCLGYSGVVMDKDVETPHPKGYSSPEASVPNAPKPKSPLAVH